MWEYDITTAAALTYHDIILLMNAEVTGVFFCMTSGNLTCVSESSGATSTIVLSAGTTGTDLFVTLTDYVAILAAVDGTLLASGEVPVKSWCEVIQDGQRFKGAYGSYDLTYALNIPKPNKNGDNPPKEDITFDTYNVKDIATPANFATPKDWSAVASKEHFDFKIYLDGVALTNWEDAVLNEEKIYSEKSASHELHKYPLLGTHFWTIDITTYDYPSIIEDLETSAAHLFSIQIDGLGKSVVLTEMKVQPKSVNIREVPEKGIKEYSFTIEIGGKSTAVVA